VRWIFFAVCISVLSCCLRRRPSPQYEAPPDSGDEPTVEDEDSEARSVFVSQLAARLTARDLGYFFEDKLGDGTVKDSRIVTDRLSRRSKGYAHSSHADSIRSVFCHSDCGDSIGYVEFRSMELVPKAIALSGTIVMGLPIMVQLTESERNKLHPGDGLTSCFLSQGFAANFSL
jgi:RNA-binding protein 23/39